MKTVLPLLAIIAVGMAYAVICTLALQAALDWVLP